MSDFSCSNCSATDNAAHRGLCWTCYRKDISSKRGNAVCHPDRKDHAGGLCRPCYRAGLRVTRATCHPDRLLAAFGLCQDCYNQLPEVKERNIRTRRLRKYGLTEGQYEAIGKKQEWTCAICGADDPTDVDHCHGSGAVRGLLCHPCNVGLGHFRDSPSHLRTAAVYLEEFAA